MAKTFSTTKVNSAKCHNFSNLPKYLHAKISGHTVFEGELPMKWNLYSISSVRHLYSPMLLLVGICMHVRRLLLAYGCKCSFNGGCSIFCTLLIQTMHIAKTSIFYIALKHTHLTHWNMLLQHLENGDRHFQSNTCCGYIQSNFALSLYISHCGTRLDHCQVQR